GIEPLARSKVAPQQQQWLLGQLGDFQRRAAPQPVRRRQRREHVHRIEQSALKAPARGSKRQMNIAAFEAGGQTKAPVLPEMDLNRPGAAPVLGQKNRPHVFDDLWRGTDPKESRLARFYEACALAERVGFRQQAATAAQQVFTLRRQPDTATEAVK